MNSLNNFDDFIRANKLANEIITLLRKAGFINQEGTSINKNAKVDMIDRTILEDLRRLILYRIEGAKKNVTKHIKAYDRYPSGTENTYTIVADDGFTYDFYVFDGYASGGSEAHYFELLNISCKETGLELPLIDVDYYMR